uniref:Sodium/myo-inositol cotransporter n=1 Tax=Strigamia maritima TaxID=126957 RepID=T1JG24_STRMM
MSAPSGWKTCCFGFLPHSSKKMADFNREVLDYGDVIAIVVYFLLVLVTGLYAMCKATRSTVGGYFLAGRFMTWLPVGASLFASNIGSEHFIGLAGSGAASGIAVGAFEFNSLFLLQLLGWVFLPVYMASRVSTLPEYMSKRFGGQRIRVFLAVLSLLLYIFTKISVNMYAGALFIKETLGWNLYLSIILLLTLTAVCTITGGLTAVMYTDTLQFFFMIIGGSVLMIRAFIEVGGFSELKSRYMEAIPNKTIPNSTCGHPRSDAWLMLRDPINSDMPWPGFILGQTPASVWYWCADQMMVQRVLAAKTLSHAQGATLFTGYMKILPIFMMVLPGMISRVLYPDVIACVLPEECKKYCDNPMGCSNLAYPLLVINLLPSGLRGVMMSVMLAALMSDLTSIFNSSSTLFTIDIYKYVRQRAGTNELLLVGKLFVGLMVVISIVWIPIIIEMQGGQLYLYIQSIAAYLAPPIAAVYLMAIFWKRTNEKGAFWGIIIGFIVGVARMIMDFVFKEPVCGEEETRPLILIRVHYMYFATILFWQTIILTGVISYFTKPLEDAFIIRTTFWTRFNKENREDDRHLDLTFIAVPEIEMKKIETTFVDFQPTKFDKKSVDQNTGDQHQDLSMPWWKSLWRWICGVTSVEAQAQEALTFSNRLAAIASLEQEPRTKLFLNINLVITLIVGICLYVIFSVPGFVAMFRTNRGTLNGYFLAGRYMTWLPVGASLFASNIGSEHFIGLAGAGAASGIAVGAFEMNAGIVLQVLGWVYLPVYIASKVSTLPEYMSKRFGGQRIRVFLSVLSLMLYIFTKVSVNLYAGSLFIRQILNWDIYLCILLLLSLTALSTITGGLAAVIYTETLQCCIMICGGLILMIKGFSEVGGFAELMIKYTQSVPNMTLSNNTCGQPLPDAWEMLRSPTSKDLPWPGFWFGQTTAIFLITYQMMVQRALASKSLSHAQGGTLFVGYLKFLPLFMMVIPGMISRVLYPDIVACAVPEECLKYCGSRESCSNLAYPLLILRLLPSGCDGPKSETTYYSATRWRRQFGLLVAVMLAALMSDLTSVFNSASTLVTMDVWRRIRNSAQTKELLLVGKFTVLAMAGLSIAWVPIILSMQGGQLFAYVQAVSSYLSPPIAAVYLMAVLWRRFNEQGAFWGLIIGFIVGVIRMGLDFYYGTPACGEVDVRPPIIAQVHYMYFALILFWCTVLTGIIVSFCTKPSADHMLIRTLFWTRFDVSERPDEKASENIKIHSNSDIIILNTIDTSKSSEILVCHEDEVIIPKWKKLFFWICGYSPSDTKQNENDESMNAHLEKLSSLKQKFSAKVVLAINLVVIVVLTIGLNAFFTYGTRHILKNLV